MSRQCCEAAAGLCIVHRAACTSELVPAASVALRGLRMHICITPTRPPPACPCRLLPGPTYTCFLTKPCAPCSLLLICYLHGYALPEQARRGPCCRFCAGGALAGWVLLEAAFAVRGSFSLFLGLFALGELVWFTSTAPSSMLALDITGCCFMCFPACMHILSVAAVGPLCRC